MLKLGRKNEVKEDLLELFACHLFNVNKEQVLPPNPQPLIPSLPDFYKQTGNGKGSAGGGGMGYQSGDGSPVGHSKFAGLLSVALSEHHLLGFEIAKLEFHHLQ